MSVEYCVVRVTPRIFKQLQQQPSILQDLMDEFYTTSSDKKREKVYVDSRDVFRGSRIIVPPVLRMLYIDEFTTALLVNFMDESSAYFAALVGWGNAQLLNGVSYGYGDISYYPPDDAKTVALKLNGYLHTLLEARFREQADNFRVASAGYFDDDRAILAHQRTFADLLRRFYNEAVQDGDFVLLLIV